MKKQISVYLLALVMLGCKKSGIDDPIMPTPKVMLPSITSTRSLNANGHYVLQKHLYNTQGKLAQEISRDETTGLELSQFYGYSNGILSYSDVSNGAKKVSKIDYILSGGKTSKMRYQTYDAMGNTELNFERSLEYKDGSIYRIATILPNGDLGQYDVYAVLSGNVVSVKTYSASGTLLITSSYEYDEKINPYLGFPDKNQSAIGYSRSNILKSTNIDHRSGNATVIQGYSYDYNQKGQPVAMYSLTSNGQKSLQTTFTY